MSPAVLGQFSLGLSEPHLLAVAGFIPDFTQAVKRKQRALGNEQRPYK